MEMSSDAPPPPPPPPPPPSYGVSSFQTIDYAGFWTRVGGIIIDSIAYGLLALIPIGVGIIILGNGPSRIGTCTIDGQQELCNIPNGSTIALAVPFFVIGVFLAYYLQARAMGKTGQTIGAKAVGIKVVHERTGQPIGFWPAVGRIVFRSFISGFIFALGYLWMLWDDKNQTWHDKVAGSIVINVR
jgi:uncharacterized RDD family membrane protein YckC